MGFPGWEVSTSENLWVGSRHTSYPLWNLFDNDPKTTWVYSGLDYPKATTVQGMEFPGEYWIHLSSDKPVLIDELRLWNGYQKSDKHFFKNSRISEVQIFSDPQALWQSNSGKTIKPVRTLQLKDSPGAKSIILPSRKYKDIILKITKIQRGAIDDLCLSEIGLRFKGKNVLPVPKVFSYTAGDECGCGDTGVLRSMKGKVFGTFSGESRNHEPFSPSGKFFANLNETSIWIVDLRTLKVVYTRPIPKNNYGNIAWIAPNRVKYSLGTSNTSRSWKLTLKD